MKTTREWIEALRKSSTFVEYQKAFSEATNLPLALQPSGAWNPAFRGNLRENAFCKLMASRSGTCAGCLRLQEKLCNSAANGPRSLVCPYGMTEVAVPVAVGGKNIGFLRTGQVFSRPVTPLDTDRVCRRLQDSGVDHDPVAARDLYVQTQVQTRKQISALTKLLCLFAEHLSMKSNYLAIHEADAEPSAVTRAREFIRTHHGENITLVDAAKASHSSIYYLCKLLRKHLGMSFTELLCRERVEEAKTLLAKPNMRISEVAYQVGFQSLTHFNRTFKKLTGESPTEFRESIPLLLAL